MVLVVEGYMVMPSVMLLGDGVGLASLPGACRVAQPAVDNAVLVDSALALIGP